MKISKNCMDIFKTKCKKGYKTENYLNFNKNELKYY